MIAEMPETIQTSKMKKTNSFMSTRVRIEMREYTFCFSDYYSTFKYMHIEKIMGEISMCTCNYLYVVLFLLVPVSVNRNIIGKNQYTVFYVVMIKKYI